MQIERFQKGLVSAVLARDTEGQLVRKSGVMWIVIAGGDVYPGNEITVALPAGPQARLEPV